MSPLGLGRLLQSLPMPGLLSPYFPLLASWARTIPVASWARTIPVDFWARTVSVASWARAIPVASWAITIPKASWARTFLPGFLGPGFCLAGKPGPGVLYPWEDPSRPSFHLFCIRRGLIWSSE